MRSEEEWKEHYKEMLNNDRVLAHALGYEQPITCGTALVDGAMSEDFYTTSQARALICALYEYYGISGLEKQLDAMNAEEERHGEGVTA